MSIDERLIATTTPGTDAPAVVVRTVGGGSAVDATIVAPLGQKTMAASVAVVLASDQSTVPTKEVRASTPSQSSVADSATSVSLLAANSNRLGATIANDSSAALYLKLGGTASLTSYTAKVLQGGYYEVPYGYTGAIDGIWATDPGDGAARITELTT